MKHRSILLFLLVTSSFSTPLFSQWNRLPWTLLEDFRTEITAFENSSATKWEMYEGNHQGKRKKWSLQRDSIGGDIFLQKYRYGKQKEYSSIYYNLLSGALRLEKVQGSYKIKEVYAWDSLQSIYYFEAFAPEPGYGKVIKSDSVFLSEYPPENELSQSNLGRSFGRWIFLDDERGKAGRFEYNFPRPIKRRELMDINTSQAKCSACRRPEADTYSRFLDDSIWVAGIDFFDDSGKIVNRWNMEYSPGSSSWGKFDSIGFIFRFTITNYDSKKRTVEFKEWNKGYDQTFFERIFFTENWQISRFDHCAPIINLTKSSYFYKRDSEGILLESGFGSPDSLFSRKRVIKNGKKLKIIEYTNWVQEASCNVPEKIDSIWLNTLGMPQLVHVQMFECDPFWYSETYKTTRYALHYEYNDQNLVERIYRQSLDTNYIAPGEPHPKVLYQFSEFEWEE